MIKKIIFSASILGILFVSCKKDRTCECTITRTGTSTTEGKVDAALIPGLPGFNLADTTFTQNTMDIHVVDKKMTKVTKSTAKNNCVSYSQPYNERIVTSVPASSFNLSVVVTNTGTEVYDCSLK